jgi:hypothetical protein
VLCWLFVLWLLRTRTIENEYVSKCGLHVGKTTLIEMRTDKAMCKISDLSQTAASTLLDIGDRESFLVNDEEQNLLRMIPHVPAIYTYRMQPITGEVLDRTVEVFRKTATGELLESHEWRYSLAVDDMIARAHDLDPNLSWNDGPSPWRRISRDFSGGLPDTGGSSLAREY